MPLTKRFPLADYDCLMTYTDGSHMIATEFVPRVEKPRALKNAERAEYAREWNNFRIEIARAQQREQRAA